VKKIRKKKKPVPKTLVAETGLPVWLKRIAGAVKENYQQAAIVGMVILFAIIFVSVYSIYSRRRQNEALRAIEDALAVETREVKVSLLQNVVDEYDGTLSAVRALYHLGDAYYASGQYDSARTCYEEFLRKYPRAHFAPNAQEGLGYVAESEGKLSEAIEHYRKLAEGYADSYVAQHAWYNIGRCYELRGEVAKAADAYDHQVSLYPMSAWTDKAETRLGELRLRSSSARAQYDVEQVPGPENSAQIVGTTSD